jgi:phosphoglycolate phosphatase
VNRFQTVLFDLDGTLIDHFAAIHRSHSYTFKQLGLPPPTMDEVRRAVGGGLEVAIQRLLGPQHLQLFERALPIYRDFWAKNMLYGVALLPGAREILEELKAQGARCAIFTNKHGPSARTLAEHLGISSLLDGVFGALDTAWLKPDREFTEYALRTLGSSADSACLVGDSPYDVQAARNGGLPSACVTTGTHSEAELKAAGATWICPDFWVLGRQVFGLAMVETP